MQILPIDVADLDPDGVPGLLRFLLRVEDARARDRAVEHGPGHPVDDVSELAVQRVDALRWRPFARDGGDGPLHVLTADVAMALPVPLDSLPEGLRGRVSGRAEQERVRLRLPSHDVRVSPRVHFSASLVLRDQYQEARTDLGDRWLSADRMGEVIGSDEVVRVDPDEVSYRTGLVPSARLFLQRSTLLSALRSSPALEGGVPRLDLAPAGADGHVSREAADAVQRVRRKMTSEGLEAARPIPDELQQSDARAARPPSGSRSGGALGSDAPRFSDLHPDLQQCAGVASRLSQRLTHVAQAMGLGSPGVLDALSAAARDTDAPGLRAVCAGLDSGRSALFPPQPAVSPELLAAEMGRVPQYSALIAAAGDQAPVDDRSADVGVHDDARARELVSLGLRTLGARQRLAYMAARYGALDPGAVEQMATRARLAPERGARPSPGRPVPRRRRALSRD